jgi:two-component system, chemotaxis family, protein-glutamate methylesterase/glutaminase
LKIRPSAQHRSNPEILVVDDSAVTREVLRAILSRAGFVVHTAGNAEIALRRVVERPFDAMVLDLNLPGTSGLELMALLPQPRPPIVICSALAAKDATTAVAALEAGAVDVIGKPELGVHDYLEATAERIVNAVRHALRGQWPKASPSVPPAPSEARQLPSWPSPHARGKVQVIAIGASAGGVEALHRLLPQLPLDLPPIVVVQHMPGAFSSAFARRLDERCKLQVHLARDGETPAQGHVLIAPGGSHLLLTRVGERLLCRLDGSEPVKRHRPSVDALFSSLVRASGEACVAVLLTGMGDDGADGLLALRQAGASTIAQDESSSLVYGMPREAARRGAASEILPLQRIGARLVELSRS